MTTEVLQKKMSRYLTGSSLPAETSQIQTWLSCTGDKETVSAEEREIIEDKIVAQVQAYVKSSLFQPKPESLWKKKKITTFL